MTETYLTENDLTRSRTSFTLTAVRDALHGVVPASEGLSMLDVGCGFGGIAASLAATLGARDVHGVDIDRDVIDEARRKGIDAIEVDAFKSGLPYADRAFDLVTCFGMLDYAAWFDDVIEEIGRVLKADGIVAIALPNLASWHNRLALLLGYQPRDVEFTHRKAVGIAPYYGRDVPVVGHIHTATSRAFRDFMADMGFTELRTVALRPSNCPPPAPIRIVDAVLCRRPSLARRFLYIGRRSNDPRQPVPGGWFRRPEQPAS